MSLDVAAGPIPLRIDKHGIVRIADTRVTLSTIVWSYKGGDTPEEIHQGFPSVSLADEAAESEGIRQKIEAEYPAELQEQLRMLREQAR